MANLFGLNQLDYFRSSLDERSREGVKSTVRKIIDTKKSDKKI